MSFSPRSPSKTDTILETKAADAASYQILSTAITLYPLSTLSSPMFLNEHPDPVLELLSSSFSGETGRLLLFNYEDASLSHDHFPPTNWNTGNPAHDGDLHSPYRLHLQLDSQLDQLSSAHSQLEDHHEQFQPPSSISSQPPLPQQHSPKLNQDHHQQSVISAPAALEYDMAVYEQATDQYQHQQQQQQQQPQTLLRSQSQFQLSLAVLDPQQQFLGAATTIVTETPTPSVQTNRSSILSHEPVNNSTGSYQVATPQPQFDTFLLYEHHPTATETYDSCFGDFTQYRPSAFDRLSSPDEGSPAPASPSEQGYTASPSDCYHGQYTHSPVPSYREYFEMSSAVTNAMMVTLSGSPLSGSSSSSSPAVGGSTAYSFHNCQAGLGDDLLSGPLIGLGLNHDTNTNCLMDPSIPMMMTNCADNKKGQQRKSTPQRLCATTGSAGHLSSSPGFFCSTPTQSSPLKQQFSSFDPAERRQEHGGHADGGDDIDLGDSDDDDDHPRKRQKKRARRIPTGKTVTKPKALRQILRCCHPGCLITCSSYPSLARHEQTHKWRDQYSPIRCAACQSPLSNEFSVQRHILRSPESSRCRRMRVYSIMGSETEIETTVRFYPNRAHGKKTVRVDLDKMKEKYP